LSRDPERCVRTAAIEQNRCDEERQHKAGGTVNEGGPGEREQRTAEGQEYRISALTRRAAAARITAATKQHKKLFELPHTADVGSHA